MNNPIIIHAADPGPWGKPKGGGGSGQRRWRLDTRQRASRQ